MVACQGDSLRKGVAMAGFHVRKIAAALFLVLLLGGVPCRGESRRSRPGTTPRTGESIQEEVSRIFRHVFGSIFEKTGNTLDPNGGTRPTAPPNGATSDTGNTLDPNG